MSIKRRIMTIQDIKDRWPELKKRIQEEHPHLTDEDLAYEIGNEGELLKRLQAKMEKNEKEITDWLHLMG